jgi:hypothetical protein
MTLHSRGRLKPREARFFGTGNAQVGADITRRRAWRISCGRCLAETFVGLSNGFLPPNVVIKKFEQQGWLVADKANGDICGTCLKENADRQRDIANSQTGTGRIEKFQQKQGIIDTYAKMASENAHLRAQAERLDNELNHGKQMLDELRGFIRSLHELLMITSSAEAALQKIEACFPEWPWERRLPKAKGSLARKATPKPMNDADYQQWLAQEQEQRERRS